MNRELQLQLYQDFIVKCTTNAKSVKNYSDFKRINECLALLFPAKKDVSILDFDNPIEFEDVINKLSVQKQFVDYEHKGGNQYSNTLKHYLRFLYAKKMFSKAFNLPLNNGDDKLPLQQIFYGAPGTGKSHRIDGKTNDDNSIRTTFHPDTDYATFVGAYKPMMEETEVRVVPVVLNNGASFDQNNGTYKEKRIVYKYEPQVFLKAYVEAWKRYLNKQEGEDDSYYLVIEEINRGNCAQIFGDLFQLLDREDDGFSGYAISPESAITKYLAEEAQSADGTKFSDLVFSDVIKKRENDAEKMIATADDLKAGKRLVLPPNLHIWATMNTSDQSLFPIDSAFKRRWDWKYVPIDYEKEEWSIVAKGVSYSWSDFLKKMNNLVASTTDSEDKMLGFYFAKAKDGIIDADTFVGKVVFYLWNDVFKDYGLPKEILNGAESKEFAFRNFFNVDGSANEDVVKRLLDNLEVSKDNDTTADGDTSAENA